MFLGLDFSTQQIKATVIDEHGGIVNEFSCSYDGTAPEFGTVGGVYLDAELKTASSPVLMWLKTFDHLLEEMKKSRLPLEKIKVIGGCAQQHGSVYWSPDAEKHLLNLDANKTLAAQMTTSFSRQDAPVWMDASTSLECAEIEEFAGGPEALQRLTGSRAYERFTASQIRKIWKTDKATYEQTERISLISSFAASLLIGRYAPIDHADATGTNLFNLEARKWETSICEFCAEGLLGKLGDPCESCTVLGPIARYYVARYGFSEDCLVLAFTGDTCASLIGIGMEKGDYAISLGTSDTTFALSTEPVFTYGGHVLLSPAGSSAYILMLGFQNGSAVRERVRSEVGCSNWDEFNKFLTDGNKGNDGYLGLFFDSQEITPKLQGRFRFDPVNSRIDSFPTPGHEVRALIEGQFLSKKYHLKKSGFVRDFNSGRLFATGGGAINLYILQVISDVFQAPVFVNDVKNSASYGAALMAASASELQALSSIAGRARVACHPDVAACKVYESLLQRYEEVEKLLLH